MKHFLSIPLITAMVCHAVSAQQVTDFRRPGDVIRVEIKFDGPDAEKITHVSLYLSKPDGSAPKDQIGFAVGFNGPNYSPSSPHTFTLKSQFQKVSLLEITCFTSMRNAALEALSMPLDVIFSCRRSISGTMGPSLRQELR